MPSAVPRTNGTTNGYTNGDTMTTGTNGVNGSGPKESTANDRIQRFAAPSRPLSPRAEHTLFHEKTRCFV